jgi:hypothetical protein
MATIYKSRGASLLAERDAEQAVEDADGLQSSNQFAELAAFYDAQAQTFVAMTSTASPSCLHSITSTASPAIP